MSILNKLFLIFYLGVFSIGLVACPQQKPADEAAVEEEVEIEVEAPVETPAP